MGNALSGFWSGEVSTTLKWLGRGLALASLVFVAIKIGEHLGSLLPHLLSLTSMVTLLVCCVCYGLSLFALSKAWQILLNHYNQAEFDARSCHWLYSSSQIAKYLPGNIFHYAGRHVLSRNIGASHASLATAALEEIVGVALVFACIALLSYTLAGASATWWLPLLLLCALLSGVFALRYMLLKWAGSRPAGGNFSLAVYQCWGLYLAFLAVSCLIFLYLAHAKPAFANASLPILLGGFTLAWLAGFLVPGAPGGIGVRETALIFLLAPLHAESASLELAVDFRLVTLLGDVVFFLCSLVLAGPQQESDRDD